MKYLYTSILCFFTGVVFTQSLPNRYQEDVFSSWTETSQQLFSTDVPQPNPGGGFYEFITGYPLNVDEFNTSDVNLYMDIFEPTGDTLSKRPLVIICFGGGFVTGSKDHWSIRLLAQQLAKRGFVTATIDYRLGMNLFDADLSNRAVYRGIQDGRAAVRFFRADADGANNYRIDPDQIFLGGHSAGAFIATHNAYLDKESERPLSTYLWSQEGNACTDLGCLDCAGDNQSYSGSANAIFSFAGALGFTDFIETENDPTVVMFHSEDDGTVPYYSGQPFDDLLWLVVGSELPDVYGSAAMAEKADEIGLTYEFYSYTNRGHGVHENDPNLHTDIIPHSEDWFYQNRLKPKANILLGDSIICSDAMTTNYMLNEISNGYYDWLIDGSQTNNAAYSNNEAIVEWDENAPNASITVVPYSKWRARGDSLTLNIAIQDSDVISWQSGVGDWNQGSNWNLSRLPQTCDDVEFPAGNYQVTIPAGVESIIRSLIVYPGVELILEDDVQLKITD